MALLVEQTDVVLQLISTTWVVSLCSNIEGSGTFVEATSHPFPFVPNSSQFKPAHSLHSFHPLQIEALPFSEKTHLHSSLSQFFFSKVLGYFAHKRAYLLVLISLVLSEKFLLYPEGLKQFIADKSLRTVIFHASGI